jgi:hypothetical protein
MPATASSITGIIIVIVNGAVLLHGFIYLFKATWLSQFERKEQAQTRR